MGHNMYINAKKQANLVELNKKLEKMGSENRFLLEEDNKMWLDDINHNEKSEQRHLKPQGRDLTMEELKGMFKTWTDVGVLSTDLYFGRTSEEEMKLLAEFIFDHEEDIEYITSAKMLIERGNISEKYHSVLMNKDYQEEGPEKLPTEEQVVPDAEGGLLLCKSFSSKPFYVSFGRVEKPSFLKNKIYKDDLYNDIYKDSRGYSYLLLPLNDFSEKFGEKVYDRAWDLGLREEPHFFLSYVYQYSIASVEHVSERFKSFYTSEERRARLEIALKAIDYEYLNTNLNNKVIVEKGRLVVKKYEKNAIINSKIDLINAFVLSLKEEEGTLWGYDNKERKLMFY